MQTQKKTKKKTEVLLWLAVFFCVHINNTLCVRVYFALLIKTSKCITVLYGWTVRALRKKIKNLSLSLEKFNCDWSHRGAFPVLFLWLSQNNQTTSVGTHRRNPAALSLTFCFLSLSRSLSATHTHTDIHKRTEKALVWIISKCMLESLTCIWSPVSRVCMSNWVYSYCTCATVSTDKIACKLDLS